MTSRRQRITPDTNPRDQALLGNEASSLLALGATPTALRGRVFDRQTDSHAHAKPWAWHPAIAMLLLAASALFTTSSGKASDEIAAAASPAVSPIQDDANLHDVQFVDELHGWAVGDHGVIWQTADGGRAWHLVAGPGECALRSISFLSDQVGWIAGGTTTPYTRLGVGVLLATTDGGRTWTEISQGRMPQLRFVRFFSSSTGILVGEATGEFPTGVIITRDGGKTWKAVDGVKRPGWRGADFLAPKPA